MKWESESELALKAVTSSTQIIEDTLTWTARIKDTQRDVVTELDRTIEGHIIRILKASDYCIIGEETSKEVNKYIPPEKPAWFVDPIDGTINLISSIPFYAISVGLVRKDEFLTGAVVLPVLKEIFFTLGDSGAYLNGKKLKVKQADIKNSLIAASFSGKVDDAAQRRKEYEFFGKINDMGRGCLRTGSAAVNICYAAAGFLQGAYGISAKIWDVAGALAVASQAGCRIYIEWMKNTGSISYVVGPENVAGKIAGYLKAEKLAGLTDISINQNVQEKASS